MLLEALTPRLRKARSVNATDTSFPAKAPTATEPSGDAGTATGASVIDVGHHCGVGQTHALLVPYGTGDADDVFAMRAVGWYQVGNDPASDLWLPVVLAELTCTMGTAAGVADTQVPAAGLFCDTLVIVSEPTTTADTTRDGLVRVVTLPANGVAMAVVPLLGCRKLELTFDMTTNDPTGANCLVGLLSLP